MNVSIAPIQVDQSGRRLNKGDVFRILNDQLTLNQFHLPDHIYRADLIPQDILDQSASDRALLLDGASLPLTFTHGYPAINEVDPFWEQLPAESDDQYAAYIAYLELPEKSNSDNPIRLLPIIATLIGRPLREITQWCHMFYWHWRARAYDLFLVACHRKQREQRMMSIEGRHFAMAEDMLNKVIAIAGKKLDQEAKILADDAEAETETKLKDLVDIAGKLVSIQRISVGMPANGPERLDIHDKTPRHTTAQETFKHIAKEGSGDEQPSQRTAEMDSLLANPEELSTIQDLMIRMHNPQHTLPAWGAGTVIDVTPKGQPAASSEEPEAGSGENDPVEDLGNPI